MPQKTFLNLSDKRTHEILNVCFEEFALNDYKSASLSRIISKLGLAKGSFYRYFENKLDLYSYLYQFAAELVTGKLIQHMNSNNGDFFQNWTNFVLSLQEIEREFPMVIRFRFKTSFEQNREVPEKLDISKIEGRAKFMSAIFERYQGAGGLRKDMDLNYFALMMTFFNFMLAEYVAIKYQVPPDSPIFIMDKELLKQDTICLLDIVKSGAGI